MSRDVWGRYVERTGITNALIADVMRAVAEGRAAAGDTEGARRARAGARRLQRKDGPGHRRHVRTKLEGT